jgi:L-threonylcarbamoyladenylate synthase
VGQSEFLSHCTAGVMAIAAANLASGALVAFPTETVYGLGADATNAAAVARIYSVKGRPVDHPLIVHVSSMQRMADWAEEIPTYAIALARDYWPGPMTLVFKRSTLAQDFITGGQVTIAVRVPGHVVALALLQEFENIGGRGVAAPSANRFGQVSPTTAQAVSEEIGQYLSNGDQIIDGGVCMVGVESTIIDCTSDAPRILRPGAITDAMIEQSTGLVVKTGSTFAEAKIRVSGSLENHYAPAATVLLSETPLPGQGFIALASIQTPPGVIRLASPANDQEFAQILYMALRQADVQGLAEVVVIQPIGTGIAVAIRDRLTRAANQK